MCNLLSSPNSLQYISNTNIYLANLHIFQKWSFPQLCARRAQGNPPNYIHPPSVGMLYPIQRYLFNWYIIPKCTFPQPCARRAQGNPPNYIHPPSVGMLYPIQRYLFNWYIIQKCTFPQPWVSRQPSTRQPSTWTTIRSNHKFLIFTGQP